MAGGQRDWDAEFLRHLISSWVTRFGAVPACPVYATPPGLPVHLASDLRWAQDKQRFEAQLRQQLAYIQANRYQGAPYYVSVAPAGNSAFTHEEAYVDQACLSVGLHILALCRYWNTVYLIRSPLDTVIKGLPVG